MFASAAACFDLFAHRPPLSCCNDGVEASVGDNLDISVGEQEVDEDAVIISGVPNPQLGKNLDSAIPWVAASQEFVQFKRSLDAKAELGRVAFLGGGYGGADAFSGGGREVSPEKRGT